MWTITSPESISTQSQLDRPSTWGLVMPPSLRPLATFSAIAPTCRLTRPVVTTMSSEYADLPRRSMVTVSSAFISSRRERISFRVLSASGCAFKAAALVDVLRAGLVAVFSETLGKTDLDNTDVARDHSFHCIANARILRTPDTILCMWG